MTESSPLPSPTLDSWITARWTTDRRYYVVEIMQDLFNVWIVRRSWGGLGSRRGSSKITAAVNYDEARAILAETQKRRKARGYVRML